MSELAHGRWGELEAVLEPALAPFLSQAAGAIESLLGPPREAPRQGTGDVDGYAGLTRRGAYERLLLSEWLLADEIPDEFIRRATSNELAYHAIARREPHVKRAVLVLLDAGPDQLGAPRVGQIAALVTLDRRAKRAGASLVWAVVGPRPEVRATADEEGLRGFIRAHGDVLPTAETLAQTFDAARDHGPFAETYLVGGRALARQRPSFPATILTVDELRSQERRALTFEVTRAGRKSRALSVDLPDAPACVQMLRRPFEKGVARRQGRNAPDAHAFDLGRGVFLNALGSHLLGVGTNGYALALGTGGQSLDGTRTFTVLPKIEDEVFLAVGFEKKKPIAVARTASSLRLYFRGSSHTVSARTAHEPGARLARLVNFSSGHNPSVVVLAEAGAFRLDLGEYRLKHRDVPTHVAYAMLEDRRQRLPLLTAVREDGVCRIERAGIGAGASALTLGAATEDARIHACVNGPKSDACFALVHGRTVATAIISNALWMPPPDALRVTQASGEVVGVITTNTGFALALRTAPGEVSLMGLDGKLRAPSFTSKARILEVALAERAPIAALALDNHELHVVDLDLRRTLTVARWVRS